MAGKKAGLDDIVPLKFGGQMMVCSLSKLLLILEVFARKKYIISRIKTNLYHDRKGNKEKLCYLKDRDFNVYLRLRKN